MIETLYALDALGTPRAFFISLLIGCGFGFALERAGFSSSRRLAGVFYFTDMAVIKVMFTALVTAMPGTPQPRLVVPTRWLVKPVQYSNL